MSTTKTQPNDAAQRQMWAFMSNRARFTIADVMEACSVTEWQRANYFSKLTAAGKLHLCGREDRRSVYTILDTDAALAFASKKRQSNNGAIWGAIRTLKVFTVAELLLTICKADEGVTEAKVRKYVSLLLNAGYLTVLQRATPGGKLARYRRVKDTGPLPPLPKTKVVLIDSKQERVVHVAGEVL